MLSAPSKKHRGEKDRDRHRPSWNNPRVVVRTTILELATNSRRKTRKTTGRSRRVNPASEFATAGSRSGLSDERSFESNRARRFASLPSRSLRVTRDLVTLILLLLFLLLVPIKIRLCAASVFQSEIPQSAISLNRLCENSARSSTVQINAARLMSEESQHQH